MRVSTLAAAFLAAGAFASPINDKRALVDEITFTTIVETIWVPAPAPTAPVAHVPDTTVLTPTTAPAVVVPQAVNDAAAAPVTTIIRDLQPTDPRYKALALVHHNVHRSNHSASSVVYNTTIESWAKAKAESCVWNEDLPGQAKDVGMNIAMGTDLSAGYLPTTVSDLWYNDEMLLFPAYGVNDLPTGPNSNFQNWGHFSQLVWKGSREIGCWTARCGPGTSIGGSGTMYFTSCLYSPPGNYLGDFTQVGRPLGHKYVGVDGDKIIGL